MDLQTGPTIAEFIIAIAVCLRESRGGTAGCFILTGEEPVLGAGADVLGLVYDVGGVAH